MPDPVKDRTRVMHATLRRRAEGRPVMSLEELRALFEQFMRQSGLCPYCMKRVTLATVALDHKIPVNRGGGHTASNLAFICQSCNKAKGNLTADEFRSLIRHLDSWEVEQRNFTLKGGVLTALKVAASFRIGANRRAKR